ncbi:hypothetical protein [Krasilnikovia sp. M28-CT-15]|uniref:hypothetical protein n=1 Tax=Krasilnikovia sp. M28-CT-15 TaxID=3373540 RepID=UPI00399CD702
MSNPQFEFVLGPIPLPRRSLSARVDGEIADEIAKQAAQAGVTTSQMVERLLSEALAARAGQAETVTINLADLHRAIDRAARAAAVSNPEVDGN